jgi:hypothetical protein
MPNVSNKQIRNPYIKTFDDYHGMGHPQEGFRQALDAYIRSHPQWGEVLPTIDLHIINDLIDKHGHIENKLALGVNLHTFGMLDLREINPAALSEGQFKDFLIHVKSRVLAHLSECEVKHASTLCFYYTDTPPEDVYVEGISFTGLNASLESDPGDSVFIFAKDCPSTELVKKYDYCYTLTPNQVVAKGSLRLIPGGVEPYEILGYRENREFCQVFHHNESHGQVFPRKAVERFFRADEREPDVIFKQGFNAKNPGTGAGIDEYITANAESTFISLCKDRETASLYPKELSAETPRWIYEVAKTPRIVKDKEFVAVGHLAPHHIIAAHRMCFQQGKPTILESISNSESKIIF